ncbi:MAG: UUP1 family membrane protein, partial [Methyloligellaceae bacterium]
MKNRHLYILSAILAVIGVAIFAYKAFVLNLPLRPDARVVNWEVQAKITFEARDG